MLSRMLSNISPAVNQQCNDSSMPPLFFFFFLFSLMLLIQYRCKSTSDAGIIISLTKKTSLPSAILSVIKKRMMGDPICRLFNYSLSTLDKHIQGIVHSLIVNINILSESVSEIWFSLSIREVEYIFSTLKNVFSSHSSKSGLSLSLCHWQYSNATCR